EDQVQALIASRTRGAPLIRGPPIAQERVLLCRLAMTVPPPRYHIVKYAGVLASASQWRTRILPKPVVDTTVDAPPPTEPARRGCTYRPWAELLRRTFAVDALECPKCKGRMKLLAL